MRVQHLRGAGIDRLDPLPSAVKNCGFVQNCASAGRTSAGSLPDRREDRFVLPGKAAAADDLDQPARKRELTKTDERRDHAGHTEAGGDCIRTQPFIPYFIASCRGVRRS